MKYNNLYLTIYTSIFLMLLSIFFIDFSVIGFISGILYAQIIEWFVHGWIQHHPFKIFKPYRDNHTYHHRYPDKPLSVQPITYFIIGSILLLVPFYWFRGFYVGYFFTYIFINVIHSDLHSTKKMLPNFIWNTRYFKWIKSHHIAHHTGKKMKYTTFSVTNPFVDIFFSNVKLSVFNNWVARNLKI